MDAEIRSLQSQMEEAISMSTNSYKLGPDEHTKFNVHKGKSLLETILKTHLETFTYDAHHAGVVCKKIVNDVTARATKLGFKRYKYVCQIAMFTNVGQAVKAVSRFLWDKATDNHVTCEFVGSDFSVVVTLFAVYFE